MTARAPAIMRSRKPVPLAQQKLPGDGRPTPLPHRAASHFLCAATPNTREVLIQLPGRDPYHFGFDDVLQEEAGQGEVFESEQRRAAGWLDLLQADGPAETKAQDGCAKVVVHPASCGSHSQHTPRRLRTAAVGMPVVDNCLSGYNSSVFAYGQTGAGKTYTMTGRVMGGGDAAAREQVRHRQLVFCG